MSFGFIKHISRRDEVRRDRLNKRKRTSKREDAAAYRRTYFKGGFLTKKELERWNREVDIYFERLQRGGCRIFSDENPNLEKTPCSYPKMWWNRKDVFLENGRLLQKGGMRYE